MSKLREMVKRIIKEETFNNNNAIKILNDLLNSNKIKEAVDYFYENGNVTFEGSVVRNSIKSNKNFKKFETLYYASEKGQYKDQM